MSARYTAAAMGGKTFFQGALSFALCRIYHTHWLLLTLL